MSIISFSSILSFLLFFFFNDPAPPELYTLSLHDALPISPGRMTSIGPPRRWTSPTPSVTKMVWPFGWMCQAVLDRKSTRLNSSHVEISYAVFCLKKKKKKKKKQTYIKKTQNIQKELQH